MTIAWRGSQKTCWQSREQIWHIPTRILASDRGFCGLHVTIWNPFSWSGLRRQGVFTPGLRLGMQYMHQWLLWMALIYFSLQLEHKPELQVAIEGYTSNTVAIIRIAIVLEPCISANKVYTRSFTSLSSNMGPIIYDMTYHGHNRSLWRKLWWNASSRNFGSYMYEVLPRLTKP